MWIEFTIFMSGILFGFRILQHSVNKKVFKQQYKSIFYMFNLSWLAMISHYSLSHLWLLHLAFLPSMIVLSLTQLSSIYRRKIVEHKAHDSLAQIILKMRAGNSFRQAFHEVIKEADPRLKPYFTEIFDLIIFSDQRIPANYSTVLRIYISELRNIDRRQDSSLSLLLAFRERIKKTSEFRRRSGQVLIQIRTQSLLLLGLYIAVLSVTLHQFGWRSNWKIYLSSLLLFSLGMLWIWKGGRKIQWKV